MSLAVPSDQGELVSVGTVTLSIVPLRYRAIRSERLYERLEERSAGEVAFALEVV